MSGSWRSASSLSMRKVQPRRACSRSARSSESVVGLSSTRCSCSTWSTEAGGRRGNKRSFTRWMGTKMAPARTTCGNGHCLVHRKLCSCESSLPSSPCTPWPSCHAAWPQGPVVSSHSLNFSGGEWATEPEMASHKEVCSPVKRCSRESLEGGGVEEDGARVGKTSGADAGVGEATAGAGLLGTAKLKAGLLGTAKLKQVMGKG